jgi:hypothetical protein
MPHGSKLRTYAIVQSHIYYACRSRNLASFDQACGITIAILVPERVTSTVDPNHDWCATARLVASLVEDLLRNDNVQEQAVLTCSRVHCGCGAGRVGQRSNSSLIVVGLTRQVRRDEGAGNRQPRRASLWADGTDAPILNGAALGCYRNGRAEPQIAHRRFRVSDVGEVVETPCGLQSC